MPPLLPLAPIVETETSSLSVLQDHATEYAWASKAANTLRSYRTDLADFQAWCQLHALARSRQPHDHRPLHQRPCPDRPEGGDDRTPARRHLPGPSALRPLALPHSTTGGPDHNSRHPPQPRHGPGGVPVVLVQKPRLAAPVHFSDVLRGGAGAAAEVSEGDQPGGAGSVLHTDAG